MKKTTGSYPRLRVDTFGRTAVAQAGGVLLTGTVRAAGLDVGLSAELARWRRPLAVHDPAKVLLDLALTLALGGDTCSDIAAVRAEPAVFGKVTSDPTLSRTIRGPGEGRRPGAGRDRPCPRSGAGTGLGCGGDQRP